MPHISSPELHSQRREGLQIPEQHQASLERTERIANMVGDELSVFVVRSEAEIPEQEGVYLLNGEINTDDFEKISDTRFEFSQATLSGRADSAHAVLPGLLVVNYSSNSKRDPVEIEVAAKGCYKRQFDDSMNRVRKEIFISKVQEEAGEIAFRPVAVVIAEPPMRGKGTDFKNYDILLVTRLEEVVTTLDNGPWQLGLNESNIEAAEAAISALARFNTRVGRHGDSKIKNVAQKPDGSTSMIDFETSNVSNLNDPIEVMALVHDDVAMMLETMISRGLFEQEPYKAHEVLQNLGEVYLAHWDEYPPIIQDAAFTAVTAVIEERHTEIMRQAHTVSLAKAIA